MWTCCLRPKNSDATNVNSNEVGPQTPQPDFEDPKPFPGPPLGPAPKPPATKNPIVVAMHDFKPLGELQICFKQGDKLEILNQTGEDWWRGRHLNAVEEGYIPVTYIASLASLDSRDWYFGNIPRPEAESLLLNHYNQKGSFLVRASDSDVPSHRYTLSVRTNSSSVRHYRIYITTEGYFFITRSEVFMTLNDLVDAHMCEHNTSGLAQIIEYPCKRPTPIINNLTPDNRWEIPMSELTIAEEIGSGNFGRVSLGTYCNTKVAIKQLEGGMTKEHFLDEATIMKRFRHKNILAVYGVCSNEEPLSIIMEYMPGGSLINHLQAKKATAFPNKLYIAEQVASGMAYLEQRQLIHRDLAARNVLLGESQECKIADFGLARLVMGEEYNVKSNLKFPIKWTAPEAYTKSRFTIKSDVWSFGILLWEIISDGDIPYKDMNTQDMVDKVASGYRLPPPINCPTFFYEIMMSCWNRSGSHRPSFESLIDQLKNYAQYEERCYSEEL